MGCLITPEPIHDRLIAAYAAMAPSSHHNVDKLPVEVRDEFLALMEDLTRVKESGDEGQVGATVRRMTDHQAFQYAGKILSLFDQIPRR
jgi:hypothetical protein